MNSTHGQGLRARRVRQRNGHVGWKNERLAWVASGDVEFNVYSDEVTMKQFNDFFILDDNSSPISADLDTWSQWFRANESRRIVAKTTIGDVEVSTVFMGIDHSFGGSTPILWETMIFGGEHDCYQARYSTREDALHGHQEACNLVDPFIAWVLEVRSRHE